MPEKAYSRYSDDARETNKFAGITMQSTTSTSSDDDNIYSDESEATPPGYKHNRKFKLNNKKHRLSDHAE